MSLPYKLGDSGDEITRWQEWFNRYAKSYAPPVDGYFGQEDAEAVKNMQRRLGLYPDGVFSADLAATVKFPAPSGPPPASRKRHLAVVFRGTGGVIGEDYVSRVCQAVSDLVEEVNPEFPATMGGIPVGTAGNIQDPSGRRSVQIGFENGKRLIQDALRQDPQRKIILGGYSLGAWAAALLRQWLLATYPQNYLCSFSFGDPTRPVGGCYYNGKPAKGHGISSWLYGDVKDYRHCWLTAPGDMYSSVPDAKSGEIMQNFFDIVTGIELSDPLSLKVILDEIPEILEDAGVTVPDIIKLLGGDEGEWNKAGNNAFTFIVNSIVGAISGKQQGLGAIIEAIVCALQFVATQPPTAPHIQYEFREVWPGQTYLGLAIQHVRDYASR